MPENIVNSPFLYSLALTLIHFLWQGLVVALALKSLFIVISNQRSQLRYALSALAMLVNLLLPFITFFVIYKAEYLQLNQQISASLPLISSLSVGSGTNAFWYADIVNYLPYLSLFWLATVLTLSCKLMVEVYNVNQLSKSWVSSADTKLMTRFIELVSQIKLKKVPKLLISLKTDVPMAIGWFKPVVLIPASMLTGLTPAQLDMLILHELAHIRRHDYLVNFIQTLVEILLFFHPAVQWVSNQMRNEREYCSDDIAVQNCGTPLAYARTLADTAALCRKEHNHTIPHMAMAASGGDLKERVIRLVNHQHHCSTGNEVSKWLASAVIVLTIILLLSQQLIKMPLLDINSGSFSLYQSSHEFIPAIEKIKNSTVEQLSNTSIAQQLLVRDENKAQADIASTLPAQLNNLQSKSAQTKPFKKAIVQKSTMDEIIDLNPHSLARISKTTGTTDITNPSVQSTLTAQHKIKQNPLNAFAKTTNRAKQATAISQLSAKENIVIKQPVLAKKERLLQLTTNDQSLTADVATQQATLMTPAVKSISERAFEITDSSQNASLANPYASMISELSKDKSSSVFTNSKNQANIGRKLLTSQNAQFQPKTYTKKSFAPKQTAIEKSETYANLISNNMPLDEVYNKLPELVASIEPRYPSSAKRKGIELDILVNFTIDRNGYIKDIQFESKNKVNYFRSTIRTAMAKWRFLPAKVNNKPVESQMSKIFSFSLRS